MHGWQANLKRTCASPVIFRVLPENEIPPVLRGDFYCIAVYDGRKRKHGANWPIKRKGKKHHLRTNHSAQVQNFTNERKGRAVWVMFLAEKFEYTAKCEHRI